MQSHMYVCVFLFSVEKSKNHDCYLNEQLLTVARYLYPFVLEYSLIAIGAISCIISTGIEPSIHKTDDKQQVARGFKNLIRVFKNKIDTKVSAGK